MINQFFREHFATATTTSDYSAPSQTVFKSIPPTSIQSYCICVSKSTLYNVYLFFCKSTGYDLRDTLVLFL